ncbi:MAG: M48 family metallopeptidase [Desulfobacterales bacterium]|nr:M48 family metallopeptidase [Desulfobacterales bacterium]
MQRINLGNITVDVELKDIKNILLSVYPPSGKVRIAAPLRFDMETIRMYAISKLGWIRKQQEKIQSQIREAPREYISRESHFFLGKRYLLKVIKTESKKHVEIKHNNIILHIHAVTTDEQKQIILQEWYREQLKKLIPKYISKWEDIMQVKVSEFGIKKMKTKWGTCNREANRIWINLELAKKPVECLEYIVVHEMVHLLERNHNNNFVTYMDKFLPQWRHLKEELNRLPVSHVEWKY